MLKTPQELTDFVLTDPLCRRLAALGAAADKRLYLVGGCVRDWLLGREALDWDLIVPGEPEPLLAAAKAILGRHAATLDASFGVYRLQLPGGPSLDFTRMQGDALAFDLRRRDLTLNSLAVAIDDGEFHDPTGGYADLMARHVRVVQRQNLEDDPLRMVRVFRFAATLPATIDSTTLAWVSELAPRAAEAATERVWAELAKLLVAPSGARVVAAMAASGLLASLLGELEIEPAVWRSAELAGGVRTLTQLGPEGERASAALRDALTNERQKLATLAMWAIAGGDIEALGPRLHWSRRELAWARLLTQGLASLEALAGAKDVARARFRLLKASQDALPGLLAWGLARDLLTPLAADQILYTYHRRLDEPPERLVDGKDLMRELGLPAGPRLAVLLAGIEEAQALGQLETRAEALAWAAAQPGE